MEPYIGNIETPDEYPADARSILIYLRVNYSNNIIVGHLNMKSLRNKFEVLLSLIADTFNIFLLSKTKFDDTFTAVQFSINELFVSHRLDRNNKDSGILLHLKEKLMPLKIICFHPIFRLCFRIKSMEHKTVLVPLL